MSELFREEQEENKKNNASTPIKTLEVLEVLASARNGLGVTEISKLVDLSKSTVHRILFALVEKRYVLKDESTKRYRLGFKLLLLTNQALDSLELRNIAYPDLVELGRLSGETVHLVWLEGDEGVYVEKVDTTESIGLLSRVGKRVPLYSTAVGKAMLAFMEENQLNNYLENVKLNPITSHTITDIQILKKQLAEIRQQGFALDCEENRLGVICVAAPIFDSNSRVIAALSTSGPDFRFSISKAREFCGISKRMAMRVSGKLGFRMD